MNLSPKTIAALAGITLVVLALMGLVLKYTADQSAARRVVWVVTAPVSPGDQLVPGTNVSQVNISATGSQFAAYKGTEKDIRAKRALHYMITGHLLGDEDFLARDTVEVPIVFKFAPPINKDHTVDIYAYSETNKSVKLVGKGLIITAATTTTTVLVSPADEGRWTALLAGTVQLFAVNSDGIGVPNQVLSPADATDALAAAIGGVTSGNPTPTSPSPAPSASPRGPFPTATPTATPTPKK